MKTKKILFTLASIAFFAACSIAPKPIAYGDDHCHFCDMTVVDKTHAAEYTTKKGKSFPFDAIECMVREVVRKDIEKDLAFVLVADYGNPGDLVDAKTATYLISEAIQSPMGANLSAFSSKETATSTQKEHGGKLYTWETLKTIIK